MSTKDGDDGEVDVDAAWAKIIAHWDDPTAVRPRDAGSASAAADADGTGNSDVEAGDVTDKTDKDELPDRQQLLDRDALLDQDALLDLEQGLDRDRLTRRSERDGPGTYPTGRGDEMAGPLSWDELRADLDRFGTPDAASTSVPKPASATPTGPRDVDRSGPSLLDGLDGDDDEEYHLPEPPPLPRPDLIGALAWLGAAGAPIMLLLAALFWRTAPPIVIGLAVVGFIAGFVTLVIRMPDHHDDDDDEGAVV